MTVSFWSAEFTWMREERERHSQQFSAKAPEWVYCLGITCILAYAPYSASYLTARKKLSLFSGLW